VNKTTLQIVYFYNHLHNREPFRKTNKIKNHKKLKNGHNLIIVVVLPGEVLYTIKGSFSQEGGRVFIGKTSKKMEGANDLFIFKLLGRRRFCHLSNFHFFLKNTVCHLIKVKIIR